MPYSSSAGINPTTTAPAFAPGFRGAANDHATLSLPVTASAAATFPKIESYPALFFIGSDNARTLKGVSGFVYATSASQINLHANGTGFSTSASTTADHVVVSISSGVITLTNAGTNNATAAAVYSAFRVN
jgi:hypothetical protein